MPRRSMQVQRRALIGGGGAWLGLALFGCRKGELPRHRDRLRTLAVAVLVPHEAVIYVAGQPMLIDPVAGPAVQNMQIAAGVAALNLQERARALCSAECFAEALTAGVQAALPTIGLAAAGPGVAADGVLEVRVDKFGIRAVNEGDPARYSVEVRAKIELAGEPRPIWRASLEIADALSGLGEGTPASVAAIARVDDPAVTGLMAAIGRAGGRGVVQALGRDLGG